MTSPFLRHVRAQSLFETTLIHTHAVQHRSTHAAQGRIGTRHAAWVLARRASCGKSPRWRR